MQSDEVAIARRMASAPRISSEKTDSLFGALFRERFSIQMERNDNNLRYRLAICLRRRSPSPAPRRTRNEEKFRILH